MPREKSPSQLAFDHLLKTIITPILKPLGYKKSGVNYHCRNEQVAIVINFQSSSASNSQEKQFYINVGLAFDEIRRQRHLDILEKPKEYDCDQRGIRFRIESIYPQAGSRITLHADDTDRGLSTLLQTIFADLAAALAQIQNLADFHQYPWFAQVSGIPGMKALVYFLLNEIHNAESEIDELVNRFAERKHLCERAHWYKRFNITGETP